MAKKSKIPGMGIEEPGLMGEVKIDSFSSGDFGMGDGDGYGAYMGGKKGKKSSSKAPSSRDSGKAPAKQDPPPKVAHPTLTKFVASQKAVGITYKSPKEAEKAYSQKFGKNIDPKTGKPKNP